MIVIIKKITLLINDSSKNEIINQDYAYLDVYSAFSKINYR